MDPEMIYTGLQSTITALQTAATALHIGGGGLVADVDALGVDLAALDANGKITWIKFFNFLNVIESINNQSPATGQTFLDNVAVYDAIVAL